MENIDARKTKIIISSNIIIMIIIIMMMRIIKTEWRRVSLYCKIPVRKCVCSALELACHSRQQNPWWRGTRYIIITFIGN